MTSHELREAIRSFGPSLGLARIGFAPVGPLEHHAHLRRWVAEGMAGTMSYMADSAQDRHLPTHLLSEARTAVVAVASYAGPGPRHTDPPTGEGVVARYARGQDYHPVLRGRLERLAGEIERLAGQPIRTRVAVDTSPLMERELAAAAGVGFIGKNTMLITPGLGSYTVLGVLLLDLELPPDGRDPIRRCGRCDLCLRACPTGALCEPYLVDARRCISYLTIEHRDPIEQDLASAIAPWVFGCDVCQEVCPYNARVARQVPDPELFGGSGTLDLDDLLALRSGAYRRLVRGRALARVSRKTLIRNAALAMGRSAGDGEPGIKG